jgi:hypothetical protein
MDEPNWDFWENLLNAFVVNALQIRSAVFLGKANEPSHLSRLSSCIGYSHSVVNKWRLVTLWLSDKARRSEREFQSISAKTDRVLTQSNKVKALNKMQSLTHTAIIVSSIKGVMKESEMKCAEIIARRQIIWEM